MHHLTVPLSSVRLTANEASGETSIAAGMRPARFHQAPRRGSLPSYNVAFVHPPIRPHVPSPTSARPAPRRPDAAQA